MTEEVLAEKLNTLKPQVISALLDNTYLSPLHEKLATKTESLKHLDILYAYHSRPEVSSEIKQQVGHSLINEFDFDKVRDHISKAIGLKIRCVDMINQYDFFGSEGPVIQYLQKLDLCNDKYRTPFYCHLCETHLLLRAF